MTEIDYQIIVTKTLEGDWYAEVIVLPNRPVIVLSFDGKKWKDKRSVINRMSRYMRQLEGISAKDEDEDENLYSIKVNP